MKTNLLILLLGIFAYNSLAMELQKKDDDEILTVKKDDSEVIRQRMVNFAENLYELRTTFFTEKLRTHDFLDLSNDTEWEDLHNLYTLVKKRNTDNLSEALTLYHQQTKSQIKAFTKGIKLLRRDENFKNSVEAAIQQKAIKIFFQDKLCKKRKTTSQKWLAFRTLALHSLRAQLQKKNTPEKFKELIEESHSCFSGFSCGVGIMALFTPLWPFGITLLSFGSCICFACQNEMYQDCKSEALNSNINDIDYKLQKAVQVSLLDDENLERKLIQYTDIYEAKDAKDLVIE